MSRLRPREREGGVGGGERWGHKIGSECLSCKFRVYFGYRTRLVEAAAEIWLSMKNVHFPCDVSRLCRM